MSKRCDICGKGPSTGHTVTHSDKKNNRWWRPNVKKVKILKDGKRVKVRICVGCLRSGRVQRAV